MVDSWSEVVVPRRYGLDRGHGELGKSEDERKWKEIMSQQQ